MPASHPNTSTRTIGRAQRDVLFEELASKVYARMDCEPGRVTEALEEIPEVFALLDVVGWEKESDQASYDLPLTDETRTVVERAIAENESFIDTELTRHIAEIEALLAGELDLAQSEWYRLHDPTLSELRGDLAYCRRLIDTERRDVATLRSLLDEDA